MLDEIISTVCETDEDILSGNFCICGHNISEEHFVGTITGISKCFGMNFNGIVYSDCKCDKIVPISYKISVKVPDYAENLCNAA